MVLHDHRTGRRLVRHLSWVVREHERLEVRLRVQRIGRHLLPAGPQLGFERLLGELLLVEIDGELDVVAVDRRHPANLADDPARVVDLVGDVAPLAVQVFLHAQLDTELPDTLVEVVARAGRSPWSRR